MGITFNAVYPQYSMPNVSLLYIKRHALSNSLTLRHRAVVRAFQKNSQQ